MLEVYRLAQTSDPTIEAARYALEAAREKVPQARAGLLPTVGLNGNGNGTHGNTRFNGSLPVDRNVRAWTWTMQLTQPLIRVQNWLAYGTAGLQLEQAEAQYAQAEQDLMLRSAKAYFDVVAAEDAIAAADAQWHAMGEQAAIARRGYEAGTHAITDLQEAKSRAELARSQRTAALNDLEARRADLEKLIGELPPILSVLQPSVVVPKPQPDTVSDWVAQARDSAPAVHAQRAAMDAADNEIARNRAEHLPTLDLTASYGNNYASGTLTNPVDFNIQGKTRELAVQLNIPLFAGGATNARVGEAIANHNKARAEWEAARRQAATDARQAFAAIGSGLIQIDALTAAEASSRVAIEGNRIGYRLGIRINSDVLNAQQQFYTAQRDLSKARYDTLYQGLKLKAAAGTLIEEDLIVINGLMAPRKEGVSKPPRESIAASTDTSAESYTPMFHLRPQE